MAGKDAGLPDALFHDFRRTTAHDPIAAAVPQHVAMQQTRHKTVQVFRRYAIDADQESAEA